MSPNIISEKNGLEVNIFFEISVPLCLGVQIIISVQSSETSVPSRLHYRGFQKNPKTRIFTESHWVIAVIFYRTYVDVKTWDVLLTS